jgi:hypothetical protein
MIQVTKEEKITEMGIKASVRPANFAQFQPRDWLEIINN